MDRNVDLLLARSIIMMLLVFIQNINVLNCRSENRTVFKERISDNPLLLCTILGSMFLQVFLGGIPETARFLKVIPLDSGLVLNIFALSFLIIIIFEIYKLFYYRLSSKRR